MNNLNNTKQKDISKPLINKNTMRVSPKRSSGLQPKRKDVASGSENDVKSESNESDDTVKLEDVQDAENC